MSAKSGFEVLCFSLFSLIPLTRGSQQLSWIQISSFSTQMPSFWVNTQSACHLNAAEKQHLFKCEMWLIAKCPPSVEGMCRPSLFELITENELDEGAGSHVIYKIFSFMLGIFRPSAALEAAVRLLASVRNSILSQVGVLSGCHFPLPESPGTVFYLTSIKTWALTPLPTSLPALSHPSSLPPQRERNWKRGESEWVIFL